MTDRQDLLVADIGGTNCRLAHFVCKNEYLSGTGPKAQTDSLELKKIVWLDSEDLACTADLLAALEDNLDIRPEKARCLSVAIAGPVLDDKKAKLTNGRLELELESLRRACPASFLLNDFTAQVYASLLPANRLGRTMIRAGNLPDETAFGPRACRAAIGAGTGLGVASLVSVNSSHGSSWQALPSEAGHTAFPFCGKEENAFHDFVCKQKQVPFATCEDVLSGMGLSLLYHFLNGERLQPAEVGKLALQAESQTLTWFARFYGRFARNWILASLCRGGLAVCGGIAARNPLVVNSGHFLAELSGQNDTCPPHLARLLEETPVSLATDENCGLWGAALAGLCN